MLCVRKYLFIAGNIGSYKYTVWRKCRAFSVKPGGKYSNQEDLKVELCAMPCDCMEESKYVATHP